MTDCQGAHNLTGSQCAGCLRLAPTTSRAAAYEGRVYIAPDLARLDGKWVCRSASNFSSRGRNEPVSSPGPATARGAF